MNGSKPKSLDYNTKNILNTKNVDNDAFFYPEVAEYRSETDDQSCSTYSGNAWINNSIQLGILDTINTKQKFTERDYKYDSNDVAGWLLNRHKKGGHIYDKKAENTQTLTFGSQKKAMQTPPSQQNNSSQQELGWDYSPILPQGFLFQPYGIGLLRSPMTVKETSGSEQTNNINNDSIQAVSLQRPFIHEVENAANQGFDKNAQLYYAYPAVEGGGTFDIGDGMKLTKSANPELYNIYYSQTDEKGRHYITKKQHDRLVANRIAQSYSEAKKTYNIFIKKEFGIDNAWDSLNYREQAFLSDYQYNAKGGLASFPKLMRAFWNKDIEAIKANYKRFTDVIRDKNGNIKSKKELGRNKPMERRIGTLYSK